MYGNDDGADYRDDLDDCENVRDDFDDFEPLPDDEELDDDRNDVDEFQERMDGDHDTAMRDAGWGTDEDYGYYGGDGDW